MKYLHNINKGVFILNGLLYFVIICGLFFDSKEFQLTSFITGLSTLIVTGAIQILINIYLYSRYKGLKRCFQKKLNKHSNLSILVLILMTISRKLPNYEYGISKIAISSTLMFTSIILGITLAIFHFNITSKIKTT